LTGSSASSQQCAGPVLELDGGALVAGGQSPRSGMEEIIQGS